MQLSAQQPAPVALERPDAPLMPDAPGAVIDRRDRSGPQHQDNAGRTQDAPLPEAAPRSYAPLPAYASEVRFGIVMYGGVSLAVYINGVANEMYEMVRATPADGISEETCKGTREVYRRLSWLADNRELREKYHEQIVRRDELARNRAGRPGDGGEDAAGPQSAPPDPWTSIEDEIRRTTHGLHPMRFVVDVISGTSAGGINGIFLAKALACGRKFKPIRDLWVKEGDIEVLLNDGRSVGDLRPKIKLDSPPRSLLNGDRMYLKLIDALDQMDNEPAGTGKPLVDELDLFVTTTDIAGTAVPLKLSRQVVYEYRHKQNFHFGLCQERKYGPFANQNNCLLAFAARCTSAFPFAFEPFTLERAAMLAPKKWESIGKDWPGHFSRPAGLPVSDDASRKRAYGDGGYLDNKPFTYVAQTLSTRQADVPVERKLVYVEPAPQEIDHATDENTAPPVPDALANSLAALSAIPRYETIREDLQEILKRNRSIERAERIVREGEEDLRRALQENQGNRVNPYIRLIKDSDGRVPPWPQFTRSKMVRYYGTAILAYRRLRASSATDDLARSIGKRWRIDTDSDRLYVLTALVRAWRETKYKESDNTDCNNMNLFLEHYDIHYRIRKLSFLLRQVDHLRGLLRRCRDGFLKSDERELLSKTDRLSIKRLEYLGWPLLTASPDHAALHEGLEALHVLKMQLNEAQRHWRRVAVARDQPLEMTAERGELAKELETVLSMLLGEKGYKCIRLRAGEEEVRVSLPPDALRRAARARTMQESVMERAKGLLNLASGTANSGAGQERRTRRSGDRRTSAGAVPQGAAEGPVPKLYAEMLAELDVLRLAKPETGLKAILGRPTLRLDPPFDRVRAAGDPSYREADSENVVVEVEPVRNATLNTPKGTILRQLLGEHYLYFDLFDQMSFALYHDAGIGEPATVDVTRISPPDANSLVDERKANRKKLAGTALANFGAFIDREWRLNDLMWGRLDGAEQLIRVLLPMQDPKSRRVRDELIHIAHAHILRESHVVKDDVKLTETLCDALAELRKGEAPTRAGAALLNRVLPGGKPEDQMRHLLDLLDVHVDDKHLFDYVRDPAHTRRETNPRTALVNLSRALSISGRMLEAIGRDNNRTSFALRWLARGGLIFQGLVAISLPGTLKALWWGNVMSLLYLAGAVLALGGLLTGSSQVFSLAFATIFATFVVNVLVFVLADIMRSENRRTRKAMHAAGVIMIALAGFGAWNLHDAVQVALTEAAEVKAYERVKARFQAKEQSGTPARTMAGDPPG
ncbi:MAG TPA: patatin-like protein [Noviherbaspirillum sp.]|uniref:patatin-like protein n=1 Tax=Noviherbaspirillum sp. TaxID=1926288 RepID=UPI002F955A04